MRRIILTSAAALLVAVPAAMGLVGNTSFAQNVPVRVPPQANVVDDQGTLRPANATSGRDSRDDHGGQRPASSTQGPDSGDDHGGQRPVASSGTGTGSGSKTPSGKASVSVPGHISAKDSSVATGNTGRHGGSGISTGGRADGPGHT